MTLEEVIEDARQYMEEERSHPEGVKFSDRQKARFAEALAYYGDILSDGAPHIEVWEKQ